MPADPSVVVAVLTFRRPGDLAELLPALAGQVKELSWSGSAGSGIAGSGMAWAARVLVVDNDPDGGGRRTVEGLGLSGVGYAHEARPGIAAARNKALAEAAGDDVLVFIDDDERPGESWLRLLLDTYSAGGAQAVVGPVVSFFPAPLDPWVVAGGFFDRRRMPTGTTVTVAATNNLLLDLKWLRAQGITFDERFGLSGGSDTLFTRAIVTAGGRMVWNDEAVVTDVVPVNRATRDWVVRRQVRSGNSWSRTALALAHSPADRLRVRFACVAKGLVRLAGGAVRVLLGTALRSTSRRAVGVKNLARGAGMFLGAFGWTYVEYRR